MVHKRYLIVMMPNVLEVTPVGADKAVQVS